MMGTCVLLKLNLMQSCLSLSCKKRLPAQVPSWYCRTIAGSQPAPHHSAADMKVTPSSTSCTAVVKAPEPLSRRPSRWGLAGAIEVHEVLPLLELYCWLVKSSCRGASEDWGW